MQGTPIKDLAVRPSKEQLEAVLNQDKGLMTEGNNVYWDIRTGELTIKPFIWESKGVPLFQLGATPMKSYTLEQLQERVVRMTWQRVRRMQDAVDFFNRIHPHLIAGHVQDGWYMTEELGLEFIQKLMKALVRNSRPDQIVAFADALTETEMKSVMDDLGGWDVEIFNMFDPMNTKHILLAIGMMSLMGGLRADSEQTATFIIFINAVIDLQTKGSLDSDVVDFVVELTKAAQKMEWTVNLDTHFALAAKGVADNQDAAIERARNYWLIQEFDKPSPVATQ